MCSIDNADMMGDEQKEEVERGGAMQDTEDRSVYISQDRVGGLAGDNGHFSDLSFQHATTKN